MLLGLPTLRYTYHDVLDNHEKIVKQVGQMLEGFSH